MCSAKWLESESQLFKDNFVYTPCLNFFFLKGEISILVSILKSKIPDSILYCRSIFLILLKIIVIITFIL